MADSSIRKLLLGWQEWCGLSALGVPYIKAKIDTGAKTSALHAFNILEISRQGQTWVQFDVHPLQGIDRLSLSCEALVIDERVVASSTGHKEHRYVIKTVLELGPLHYPIELTLSNRDPMIFRMLLGREALNHRVYIDPAHKMLLGQRSTRQMHLRYRHYQKKKHV